MPKWPRSSGPVRNEFGCCSAVMSGSRRHIGDRARQACTRLVVLLAFGWNRWFVRKATRSAHEGPDFFNVLVARGALDARGHIDRGRARNPQRLGDVAGIEAAGEHEG